MRPKIRDQNLDSSGTRGSTVWLTGLPSSGKSTIARATARVLLGQGRRVEVLDGDDIRAQLSSDLGFDRASRDINVHRIGWLAQLLARNGVTVLVAAIAPYAEARRGVRAWHEAMGIPFVEVYVAAPVECCRERDVKGLYARHRRHELSDLTGVDDPYEEPADPEVLLRTDQEEIQQSVTRLASYLNSRGLA